MIYQITNDGFKFQEPTLSVTDFIDKFPESVSYQEAIFFSQNQIMLSGWWIPVEFGFKTIEGQPKAPIPDICEWNVGNLILNAKAKNALNDFLSPNGELLPVTCNGEAYYIFNCSRTEPIDEINSIKEIYGGEVLGFKKLVFNNLKHEVFRSTEQGLTSIFCQDIVKECVEKHGLKGITFINE